jgi:Ferredoxin-like domain in Api92-like protein
MNVPNWVSNELILTGLPSDLEAVLVALGDADAENEDRRLLDFGRLSPIPEDVLDIEATPECLLGEHNGGPMDSHCWREQHWGSTRNACWLALEGSAESGVLRYEFSTAWTPPRPLLLVISSLWPGLSIDFAFAEPNMVSAGRHRYTPGHFWGQAEAAFDEDMCRAVLGNSALASYFDVDEPLAGEGCETLTLRL